MKTRFSSFLLNYENNSFDNISNEAIENHIVKINKLNESEKSDALKNLIDIIFLEEELEVLAEMKLVYAYKNFELHLKSLLKDYYPELKESNLYKLGYSFRFLKI